MQTNVGNLIRRNENLWILGSIKTSKYVIENFYEDLNTIEAYLNSKHISGDKDSLGRDKPFFNIVLAARNIWFRATDLDRKNVKAMAKKLKDLVASYLYTIHLNQWMRDVNFGQFLNDWGLYLASYNACITKWVDNSKGLTPMVMTWNKMIVDVLNFDENPKIEILELTQDQLRDNPNYDKEMVENLINAQRNRVTIDRQTKDLKADFVRLYEIHGKMPLSWLTGNDNDENTYVQQMQVVSYVGGKEKGKFDDFILIKGKEKNDPYVLTQLIPATDGSISLMGAVKSLFEAQWMTNHTIKNIKDQLDLASKLIFQTNDPAYANKNVLENIEQGQIMVYAEGKNALAQVQNNSHDIGSLESFMGQWKELTQQITNTPAVLMGQGSASIASARKEQFLIQQAQANFDIMTQNKGLSLEQIMIKFVTPYLLKKMNNSKEIVATLDGYGIDKIDQMYINSEATKRFNAKAVDAVLNNKPLPNLQQEQQGVQQELQQMGGQRFIKPSDVTSKQWSDLFKDFEANIIYEITDENQDKNSVLQALNTLFTTIANPAGQQALQTPEGKLVFNEILNTAGIISPIEIGMSQSKQIQQPAQVGAGNNQQIQQ